MVYTSVGQAGDDISCASVFGIVLLLLCVVVVVCVVFCGGSVCLTVCLCVCVAGDGHEVSWMSSYRRWLFLLSAVLVCLLCVTLAGCCVAVAAAVC